MVDAAIPHDPAVTDDATSATTSPVLDRNIEALSSRRRQHDENLSVGDRIPMVVTSLAGSMVFVYVHLALLVAWILWNSGSLGLRRFDPSFSILAVAAAVEAIFLSTFVLISQNRISRIDDERANLNVHVSLLTEHELTKLISLVVAVAKKLDIELADHPELQQLQQDTLPEAVMEATSGRLGEPDPTAASS